MRILLALLLLAALAAAQAQQAHELCYRKKDGATGAVTGESCMVIPAATQDAVSKFISEPEQSKLYKDSADLVFQYLRNLLYAPLLERYPTGGMVAAEANAGSASNQRKQALDAALPSTPATAKK